MYGSSTTQYTSWLCYGGHLLWKTRSQLELHSWECKSKTNVWLISTRYLHLLINQVRKFGYLQKISLCKWNLRNLQPNTLDRLKMIQWLILSVSPFEVAQLWTPDVVEGASSTWLIVRNMAQRNDPRSCILPSRTRRWWENSSSDSLYRLGKGTVTVHLSSYLFLFYWHCLFNETHLAQSCPVIQFSATYHVVLILSS